MQPFPCNQKKALCFTMLKNYKTVKLTGSDYEFSKNAGLMQWD